MMQVVFIYSLCLYKVGKNLINTHSYCLKESWIFWEQWNKKKKLCKFCCFNTKTFAGVWKKQTNLILLYMFAPAPFLNTNHKTFHNSIHYSDYIHCLSIYNVLGLAMHVRTYCNNIKIQVIFSIYANL